MLIPVKHKQNEKSKEALPTGILSIVGYTLLTAILWTLPFDMYKLIGITFTPDAYARSDWLYRLFIYGTLAVGLAVLVYVDVHNKKNIWMSLLKWFIVACAINYVFLFVLLEFY